MSYLKRTGTEINDVSWDETELAPKSIVDKLNTKIENISDGTAELPYLKTTGGTLTGALTLNGAPTEDLQAATKKYCDDKVSNVENTVNKISDGTAELPYLKTTGGTLTGALTLNGAPTEDLQAATKAYVDLLKWIDDYKAMIKVIAGE